MTELLRCMREHDCEKVICVDVDVDVDVVVNTDFPVVFYRAITALGCWPSSTILCIHIHSIGIGTHSCTVSRTMTTCIYVLSPNPMPIADARHYYPLIINASQAIRVPTSLRINFMISVSLIV